jgi:hypothetical protein
MADLKPEFEISSVADDPTDIRNITGTVSLPTGAATDRTLAAAPFSSRLSDGSAFYVALTDAQLRATAVPISGNVTSSVTDSAPATQNITAQDTASSTATGANSQSIITGAPTAGSVANFTLSSKDSVKVQTSGTWTGTLAVEQSFDSGTTWVSVGLHQTGTAFTTNSFTGNFIGGQNCSGATNVRIRSTAAWTGTATIRIVGTENPNSIYIANGINIQDQTTPSNKLKILGASTAAVASDTAAVVSISPNSPLPTGTNSIGSVTANLGTIAGVSTETTLAAINAKLNSLGQKTSANSAPIVIASDQSAIPITGTVTSTPGLGQKKTFTYTTGPITGATATGTKSLAYVFHSALNLTQRYQLMNVVVDQIAGNGPTGSQRIELRRITAENVTPGGTTGTAVAKESTDTTTATLKQAVTGAPTRVTQPLIAINSHPTVNQNIMLVGFSGAENADAKPWTMQVAAAIGYEVTQEVVSTLSTAPTFNITFEWDEV